MCVCCQARVVSVVICDSAPQCTAVKGYPEVLVPWQNSLLCTSLFIRNAFPYTRECVIKNPTQWHPYRVGGALSFTRNLTLL